MSSMATQLNSMVAQLFRVERAAEALGVSHWTMRLWVKQGRVKPIRLGKLLMFSKAEIDRIAREGIARKEAKSGSLK